MVDVETVCCMCGDVGFPEKLFRCNKCHHRIQHSYCSNYYGEFSQEIEQCDWCQSEAIKNSSSCHITTSSKKSSANSAHNYHSEYSGNKIKHHRDDTSSTEKGKSPSPRTSTRRYKLLKDVMC